MRGHRVELTEVEQHARRLPGVHDAHAVLSALDPARPRLVLGIVAEVGYDVAAGRDALRRSLPEYMVPTAWCRVDRLPLTPNGKVDEESLVDAAALCGEVTAGPARREASEAARYDPDPDYEAVITRVWAEVLGTEDFDLDEAFFDIGGDSLTLAQVHARLVEALPACELRVVDLFRFPTVLELGDHLRRTHHGSC